MNFRKTGLGISISTLLCMSALSSARAADALSPKETYLKYRSALAAAGKITDLTSFMCKRVNEEIEHTPADMKPMMFGLMKEMTPKTFEVVSESIKEDNATLSLTGKDAELSKLDPKAKEQTRGTVTLVRENGVWKIDKESWNSKITSE